MKSAIDKKIVALINLTRSIWSNTDVYNDNIICIDGGDNTGTTSSTHAVGRLHKFRILRCPSVNMRPKLLKKLSEKADATDLMKLFVDDIFDVMGNITETSVVDRGLLSTIVYQSGILDDNNDLDTIEKKCGEIYYYVVNHDKFVLPSMTYVLCGHKLNDQIIHDTFRNRIETRRIANDGKLDVYDNLENAIKINSVYTKIAESCRSVHFEPIQMDQPIDILTKMPR